MNEKLENLIREASSSKSNSLALNILLEEAAIVSVFVNKYYESSTNYPGLADVGDDISPDFAETLLLLSKEASSVQLEYLRQCELDKQNGVTGVTGEMRDWIKEMKHILRWALRPGQEDVSTADKKELDQFIRHQDTQCNTAAGMSQVINNYLVLATSHQEKLSPQLGFTPEFIGQAEFLMKHSYLAKRGRPRLSTDAKALLIRRRKLQSLIMERIRTVRTAARFVFRNHPERIKEVSSSYERKRRTVARKKQQQKKEVTHGIRT